MSPSTPASARFAVGDRVILPWQTPVVGEIIEDRGPLGRNRSHVYAIDIPTESDEPYVVELPEDYLKPAGPEDRTIDVQAIVDYLKEQGLLAILLTNEGSRRPVRVWLRKDSLGNVTHTFKSDLGWIGGVNTPLRALYGRDRIFEPSVPEVIAFLRGFELDESQAEEVVRAVGTVP